MEFRCKAKSTFVKMNWPRALVAVYKTHTITHRMEEQSLRASLSLSKNSPKWDAQESPMVVSSRHRIRVAIKLLNDLCLKSAITDMRSG